MTEIKGYTVKSTYLFDNQMVMTFGFDGQQIPDLQGPYTKELEEKIRANSGMMTEWSGFGEASLLRWRDVRDELQKGIEYGL
jgi:hypothetical protein